MPALRSVKRTCGEGNEATASLSRAMSISVSRTFSGSAEECTVTSIDSRPTLSARIRFFTTPETRFEFGTMTAARSKVSISVERTLILRT